MNIATPKFGVGASALRKEDPKLIRGEGAFTDDIRAEGELRGFVLRLPHAAARFVITDLDAARASEGVHLVLTAADVAHLGPVVCQTPLKQPDGTRHALKHTPLLCDGEVRHVGDAVAFIVAETLEQAQDASELIDIDWEFGEAHADLATALDEGSPLVWPDLGTNQAFLYRVGDAGATDAAFADADHVTTINFINNRLVSNYMETRACLAEWDAAAKKFTLTLGSQGVHGIRRTLAKDVFRMDLEDFRVVTRDVGGGFGTKAFNYREYPLSLEAARQLGRPVKWVCDRTEHFLADAHGRDHKVTAALAMDKDRRITGLKIDILANMGGYLSQFGPFVPTFGGSMATGVYDIQNLDFKLRGVYTHTTPVDAYRGAGRPEAAFLIERLIDAAARELAIPVEDLRRRNFIRPEQFPYLTAGGRNYDVGEFDGHMTRALEKADYAGFPDRAREAESRGKLRGFGTAVYIEACAFAGSEPARLTLDPDGGITLYIGTQTNGQGHATAYSQFVADHIGIDFEKITVRQGDTSELAKGGGTGGSRSIPLGGVSVSAASRVLAEKMKKLAADELEASAADIELVDGSARIVGTDRVLSYADIARAAKSDEDRTGDADVVQDEATYPNGTHICEIEIDPDTGHVDIVRYTIVDDFGMTVNPVLLLGQVHGGVVQGIGQCLSEGVVYSEDGQLLTASFMDYTMPRADTVPFFDFETRNVPSTTNAMGIKGAGEAATIGSCPAVMNALVDALDRSRGVRHIEMPATPQRVWEALNL
ncbi:MAG: xanthine dehydrogenase family protein molybdopterin-binding subunit [Hoeflea sp.]|uniref:xanthine dehydrogenase family protein molybdopterin-binding subunit n=1 Tax=Hoeflea sp. TaxID=1940281 RepID=UPI001D46FCCF|nr:xanthine dehydrogenase family protein molybdopterin-binding subunit [Hoeflea sp.]MBU4530140.1 xanthine dehydrogenase family protein molybdopterin-binding subunit [Alphaproteobacteria bacterium]MBU4542575.1 xanthine dehydrogenase family protein molybdopterin-binding subunit [Alphaproteobacteria bacterium]MBU4551256.1 xanthine dehydrogenase family protein molybdopterin-binding subunit [Alphaproteobacteria bacterium]MBV1723079.1 xanthine dehydrogenase family protein molybdopterin-binding subuni